MSSSPQTPFWSNMIEYLKDPFLVAKFQRKFGVLVNPLDTLSKVDKFGIELEDDFEYDEDNNENQPKNCNDDQNENGAFTNSSSQPNNDSQQLFKRHATREKRGTRKLKNKDNQSSTESLQENMKEEDSGISSCGSVNRCYNSKDNNKRLKKINDESGETSDSSSCADSHDRANDLVDRVVTNKFWYYLFKFGTALGDEVFYASFFSFWFWNIDGAVGRRVVMVWALVMYIGQGLKDIICWPRPACPPVIRLETKWELEYGMPSTHAMTGAAVPFSILIFTAYRYEFSIALGVFLALTWCILVCSSRLYLGMHSVLDIVAGLSLVVLLFIWVIPFVDWLDPILLTHEFGALYLLTGAIVLAICSPGGDKWTPARGDTIVILGSAVGLITGAWLNFQLGVIRGPPIEPPYPVLWPSYRMLGLSLLRLAIGLCIVVATRAFVKFASYATIRGLMQAKNVSYLANPSTREVFVELTYKFISYTAIGISVVWLSPLIFRIIGIERPTFHTEV